MRPAPSTGLAHPALGAALARVATRPPVSRQAWRHWVGVLAAGLRQGLCSPALQGAIQAQLPALALAQLPDRTADLIAAAGVAASLKGVQA